MKASWDIFCCVVDNYGDIGVTWRLARQLAAEHDVAVRLWVDDLKSFERLWPSVQPQLASQWQQGVDICQWPLEWPAVQAADVVIEAFGCTLPEAYRQAMAVRTTPALWLNLEYLSAESWVSGCHGLPSPQPDRLQKYFFFPGFVEKTGGLLREGDLLARRQAFQADPQARRDFLASLGVTVPAGTRLMSLFAYENASLGEWLDALAADASPTHVLVPQGRVLGDVHAWLAVEALEVGAVHRRGALSVQVVPFVPQDQYDLLLWCCDFNAVRGEDSFVRAQWAGRPLLWHIYEQEEYAHWEKLEAFLALYVEGLSAEAGQALTLLWRAWNQGKAMGQAWGQVLQHWDELRANAEKWCARQAAQPDLATALVKFYRNWI
ncbi:elongation factor P maturation arginine rhamnosyltransferase EarP [Pseudomonas sp.]|uniref:elongation factor P maturation arginine rhamnosyltransferase EarP n=1 Tax=Pseudomonas sp. TaxID=306 RepID=UPI003CC54322